MVTSREIRLKSRPVGMPNAENSTVTVPDPAPGEVQVKNIWMTVESRKLCPVLSTGGTATGRRDRGSHRFQ
jgi:NADPH-dependent curcumin reductase CurA